MEKFTKPEISESNRKEDIIYSELTALCYLNEEFFDFLEDEKWKYQLNDNVFNTSLYFELEKSKNLKFLNNERIEVCIGKDWEYLKCCKKIATELKSKVPVCESIIVSEGILNFHTSSGVEVFRGKRRSEMVNILDLEKCLGVSTNQLYGEKIDGYIQLFINHLNEYLKPEYLKAIKYFTDIFREMNEALKYEMYKNFKTKGLGIRMENMPGLYYNNLCNYCKDLVGIKEAFREHDLMMSHWLSIKKDWLNNKYLLPIFKDTVKPESFLYLIEKYYSLANIGYFSIDNNCDLLRLPSKKEFEKELGEYGEVSFKTDKNTDFLVSVNWSEIEAEIKVSFGLVPDEFIYSLEMVETPPTK